MQVSIKKLTDKNLSDLACSYTVHKQVAPSLSSLYGCEHSPIRTQIFVIELFGVPLEVRDHLTRHKVGIEFFCRSHRDDRGGGEAANVTYETLTDMLMLANAQSIINLARKRLCGKAHWKTREVMQAIKMEMANVDKDLCDKMVPECYYRNHCPEKRSCGFFWSSKVRPLIEMLEEDPARISELIKGAFFVNNLKCPLLSDSEAE